MFIHISTQHAITASNQKPPSSPVKHCVRMAPLELSRMPSSRSVFDEALNMYFLSAYIKLPLGTVVKHITKTLIEKYATKMRIIQDKTFNSARAILKRNATHWYGIRTIISRNI